MNGTIEDDVVYVDGEIDFNEELRRFIRAYVTKLKQDICRLESENVALKTRLEIALAQAEGREPDVESAINQ